MLFGYDGEIPIGQSVILRRVRRDASDNPVSCVCRDSITHEPEVDYGCTFCHGMGYLFDEELVTCYKVVITSLGESSVGSNLKKLQEGESYIPAARFYFPSDVEPSRFDHIVEIALDEEGDPELPYNRLYDYEIVLVRDLRGDYGKIEFWICSTQIVGPNSHRSI